jgi:hypothetical protein
MSTPAKMNTINAKTGRLLGENGLPINVADIITDVYDSTNHVV